MGRWLAFDIGEVRTGIAESDPMQIIATGLTTIKTDHLLSWLDDYLQREAVDGLIIGEPKRMHGLPSDIEASILSWIEKIKIKHPELRIERQDERFTSRLARRAMVEGGMKASRRKKNDKIDEISAVIILQSWMDRVQR